jgi:CheY-like chemotaxis protein
MLLVVEDESPVRGMVVRMLEAAGYRVVTAGSGVEALEVFGHVNVRLVITDLKMPEMTGDQLAEHLRQRKPMLPILFISGYTSPRTTSRLPGPLLRKPFTEPALLQQVRQLLQDA